MGGQRKGRIDLGRVPQFRIYRLSSVVGPIPHSKQFITPQRVEVIFNRILFPSVPDLESLSLGFTHYYSYLIQVYVYFSGFHSFMYICTFVRHIAGSAKFEPVLVVFTIFFIILLGDSISMYEKGCFSRLSDWLCSP